MKYLVALAALSLLVGCHQQPQPNVIVQQPAAVQPAPAQPPVVVNNNNPAKPAPDNKPKVNLWFGFWNGGGGHHHHGPSAPHCPPPHCK